MWMDILNKLLLIVLMMSSLNVTRHLYYFGQAWVKSDSDNPQKYKIDDSSLWVLSMSISYILTSIISGVYM